MSPSRSRAIPARRPWRAHLGYVMATALGLLMGAVLFAPAHWLAPLVERASQGQVLLRNAHGTVWQGQADVLLSAGNASRAMQALPQGLQWTLSAAWAQGPTLQLRLNAPCCTPSPMTWQARYAKQGLRLSLPAHQSQWPLNWLSGLGSPWNTIQLQGRLQLQTMGEGLNLTWAHGQLKQSGTLNAHMLNVSSSLSTLKPLGSYQLHFAPDTQGTPHFHLSTLNGDLRLQADGLWANGHLRLRGMAEAAPQRLDTLSNLLNILGRRDGSRAHLSLG